jgi:hypothetical protein
MSWRPEDDTWIPSPEQLAAYADGELDRCGSTAPLKRRIEVWLVDHPGAAAELEAQHRLARLWKTSRAPEPSDLAWDQLWQRIKQAPPHHPGKPGRLWTTRRIIWAAALLATAASLVLAVTLSRRDPAGPSSPEADLEPFPVALAEDVDIFEVHGGDTQTLAVSRLFDGGLLPVASSLEVEVLHVNGADTRALVVGELPVKGDLVLARNDEIKILNMDPDETDNMVPDVLKDKADNPMIWAPVTPAPDK